MQSLFEVKTIANKTRGTTATESTSSVSSPSAFRVSADLFETTTSCTGISLPENSFYTDDSNNSNLSNSIVSDIVREGTFSFEDLAAEGNLKLPIVTSHLSDVRSTHGFLLNPNSIQLSVSSSIDGSSSVRTSGALNCTSSNCVSAESCSKKDNIGDVASSRVQLPLLFLSPGSMMAASAAPAAPQELNPHESQFSLRWNNHISTFCHVLSALREKDKYSDVTLACEGRFYNVHRLVLGVCSDYFDAMLERTPCKHPVIVLKDIKAEDLEALLSYMYVGEVSVSQSDLGRLIKAAEMLCIKGLAVPDEPPPGYADASLAAANVVRDKHPGLLYATSEGNVMTFVTHNPQAEQQQTQQQAQQPQQLNQNLGSRTTRNSLMPNKKRRKEDNSASSNSSSTVAMVTSNPLLVASNSSSCSPASSAAAVMNATVSVDESGTGALVYHHTSPPSSSASSLNGRTVGVVEDSMVKEEDAVEGDSVAGAGGSVVASVLTGKNNATISYVVTTDHAGILHAQAHDPRFDTHTDGTGDHTAGDGATHQPQPLAEAVAEALAGPSGMQSWLSGGELSQASFTAVDSYTAAAATDLGQHNLNKQTVTSAHLSLDGAGSCTTSTAASTTDTSTANSASIVGTILPAAAVKRLGLGGGGDLVSTSTTTTSSSTPTTTSASSNQLTCPHCYRSTFRQTSDLKRHIRIHTGEKPYHCTSCPYKASRKDLLHTHCAKIHNYTYPSSNKSDSAKDSSKEEKESSKRKWSSTSNNAPDKDWEW